MIHYQSLSNSETTQQDSPMPLLAHDQIEATVLWERSR